MLFYDLKEKTSSSCECYRTAAQDTRPCPEPLRRRRLPDVEPWLVRQTALDPRPCYASVPYLEQPSHTRVRLDVLSRSGRAKSELHYGRRVQNVPDSNRARPEKVIESPVRVVKHASVSPNAHELRSGLQRAQHRVAFSLETLGGAQTYGSAGTAHQPVYTVGKAIRQRRWEGHSLVFQRYPIRREKKVHDS